MSKPIKALILADYTERFKDIDNALLIDIRGIAANDNNTLRLGLAKKDILITVVKNTLARKAFAGTSLELLTASTIGPTAIAWGAESVVEVARELTEWARKVEDLELKAAVLDGELFEGEAGVKLDCSLHERYGLKVAPQGPLLGAFAEGLEGLE